MNKFLQFAFVAMFAMTSSTLVSCSDDDDDNNGGVSAVNPAEVFTGGMPSNVDGATITRNAEGLVIAIADQDEIVTFDYTPVSRATNYDMTMTITDREYPDDKEVFYIQLNDRGFISHALETYPSEVNNPDYSDDTWDFDYNSDGQMILMKRSEGGNEVTTITYTDGNITTVSITDEDRTKSYTISYTSDKVSTPIVNKGCLMLFDTTFSIDMDEMEIAYYAGLLGKSTKNLPVLNKRNGSSDDFYEYAWTLNSNGYPTQMVETSYFQYGDSWSGSPIKFAW